MINFKDNYFELKNDEFTYVMKVLDTGHLAHLHFGGEVECDFSELKYSFEQGSTTSYKSEKPFSLNTTLLEVSTFGKGDYREPSIHLRSEDSTFDFLYEGYQLDVKKEMKLPSFNDDCETLIVTLKEKRHNLKLELMYNLYSKVMTRSLKLINESNNEIEVSKIMSMNIDFLSSDYSLLTLDGAWIREREVNLRKLFGTTKLDSKKGVSGADHNPFIAITKTGLEEYGDTYGFGLVYSGNYEITAEVNPHDLLRIQLGVNSFDFNWKLKHNEEFQTPEVVMTYSSNGLNGMSKNFHEEIQKKLLRGVWKNKLRPVKINNWEATYFDFNERKLLKLAKTAKQLGIEMFVLDDGWFGKRDDDTSSLGDFSLNSKKIKDLSKLIKKINKLDMMFGIWMEPEMISVDSNLYRKHPDWAITIPNEEPSLGRNQLVIDMTNADVIDYLDYEISNLLSKHNIEYVKWDMNRNLSDVYGRKLENQGEFYHRYVLGLYELLDRLTTKFPNILFESCSSGGNRFDLGMLYYMPITWTSDNTDAYERQKIQYGTSMLYPLCTMVNHVSASPNHQTFRNTPLESRFNVAAFGVLGYELDVTMLSRIEKKMIKDQISWYKKNREELQFGEFNRISTDEDLTWSVGKNDLIVGKYQGLNKPNPRYQLLKVPNATLSNYELKNRTQYIDSSTFGSHINMVLPIKIRIGGLIHKLITNNYLFKLEEIKMKISGKTLKNHGVDVNQRFTGTGYDETTRLNEDFSSRIYELRGESYE